MALARRGMMLIVAALLVAGAVVFAMCSGTTQRRRGVSMTYEVDAPTDAVLDAALHVMQLRLDATADGASVHRSFSSLKVMLPDVDLETVAQIQALLARTAS